MLYTRFSSLPKYLCMDNGCNLHHYILNREPQHFQSLHMYIDELHFRGHKHCCPAYSTGKLPGQLAYQLSCNKLS